MSQRLVLSEVLLLIISMAAFSALCMSCLMLVMCLLLIRLSISYMKLTGLPRTKKHQYENLTTQSLIGVYKTSKSQE